MHSGKAEQGQLIGYVGKTGLATGPHVHYEFRVRGVHKDPLRVKLPKASPITAKLRREFRNQTDKLDDAGRLRRLERCLPLGKARFDQRSPRQHFVNSPARWCIGLMTGTSMDGIDAALVRVSSDSSVEFVHGLSCTLDTSLSNTLNKLASGEPVLLDDFAAADTELGEALADAAVELATQANVPLSAIAAIGSHGQTVHHRPGKRHANTLQIGNPQ